MRSVSRFGKLLEAGRHPPMRRHNVVLPSVSITWRFLCSRLSNSPKGTYHDLVFQFNPFHIRGETYMAKIHWALACLLLFVTAAAAQEHYTEGPVWRVTLVRVKPAQMDAYLTSLRQATKPLLEEEKRTGAIVDYKIFLKETNSGPQDWYSRAWPVQAPLGRGFSSGGRTLTVGRIPARSLSAPKLMRLVKALQSPRHGRGYVRNRAEVSDWMNIPAQAKLELIG